MITAANGASRADDVLDETYSRLHRTGPEFEEWLSNHGPRAADALIRLGYVDEVGPWIDKCVDSRTRRNPDGRSTNPSGASTSRTRAEPLYRSLGFENPSSRALRRLPG